MSEAITIFEIDTERSIKRINIGKITWFWSWMKGIDDRDRDGRNIIRIPLYKPFKMRVMEQGWCGGCGGRINNIFCSKTLK